MPGFPSVKEFIKTLYHFRNTLDSLFEKRHTEVSTDQLLHATGMDEELLNRLVVHGVLEQDKYSVYLNGRIREFLEDFLEVEEEVHVQYIQEHFNKIREHQAYFLKSRNQQQQDRHRKKIKHYLRLVGRVTTSNVKALRRNTEEAYKSETDYAVKKEKLQYLRNQRDQLAELLHKVQKLLEDELFFRNAVDEELLLIVHHLKNLLQDARHNLLEVQQQIIAYLNQVMLRTEIIEKVLKLKSMRNRYQLREQSNFDEVAAALQALPARQRWGFQGRISAHALFEDKEVQQLITKINSEKRHPVAPVRTRAAPLQPGEADEASGTRQAVNLKDLIRIFQGKNQDLFAFVMGYDAEQALTDAQRVRLFCRLASHYSDELRFTSETRQWKSLEYAVIYPR